MSTPSEETGKLLTTKGTTPWRDNCTPVRTHGWCKQSYLTARGLRAPRSTSWLLHSTTDVGTEAKALWVSLMPPSQLKPTTAAESIFSSLSSPHTLAWLPANYLDNSNFPAQRWRAGEFWQLWFGWLACQPVKCCTSPPPLCSPSLGNTKGSMWGKAAVKTRCRRQPQLCQSLQQWRNF